MSNLGLTALTPTVFGLLNDEWDCVNALRLRSGDQHRVTWDQERQSDSEILQPSVSYKDRGRDHLRVSSKTEREKSRDQGTLSNYTIDHARI